MSMLLLDTSVAIDFMDGDNISVDRVAAYRLAPAISVVTRVELEGGVYRDGSDTGILRDRLDRLLTIVEELSFTSAEAEVYGRIVAARGYSRRKIIDRMIAATAIVVGAVLITSNPGDFQEIPGLRLEAW